MTQQQISTLTFVAGSLHFAQIPGMFLSLRALRLGPELGKLPLLVRRMVLVMAGGIVLCVLGIGLIVTWFADQVAATRLGTAICLFGALFWGYRSTVQFTLYDRLWPAHASIWQRVFSVLFPVKTALYLACVVLQLTNPA